MEEGITQDGKEDKGRYIDQIRFHNEFRATSTAEPSLGYEHSRVEWDWNRKVLSLCHSEDQWRWGMHSLSNFREFLPLYG
jgi:hypothetical protein